MGLKDALGKVKAASDAAQAKIDEARRLEEAAELEEKQYTSSVHTYVTDILEPLFAEIYNNAKELNLSPAYVVRGEGEHIGNARVVTAIASNNMSTKHR